MKRLAFVAILSLGACATIEGPTNLSGQWGGPHAGVTLDGGLGAVEYDCASGTIDQAVVAGKDGRFTAAGTHRTGQPGPVRVGQVFRSQRATYSGTIVKDDMTLTVKLEDGSMLGPFALKRGVPAELTRCL